MSVFSGKVLTARVALATAEAAPAAVAQVGSGTARMVAVCTAEAQAETQITIRPVRFKVRPVLCVSFGPALAVLSRLLTQETFDGGMNA